ncbi:hypothetical protein BDF14DRAFT_1758784 [Spinellus fusiger]|nr:hypothetical protein BDF14DRAFT_1758784 [Spinellus fusiger]
MKLTIAEMARRKAAESIDVTTPHSMVKVDPLSENMIYRCCSFVNKDLSYRMFLVSRTHSIPFYNTAYAIQQASITDRNTVIQEDREDYQSLLEQQQQRRLEQLKEDLEQSFAILNAQVKDLGKSKDATTGLLETTIQNIKTSTSTIENSRHPYQHPPCQNY